MRQLADRQQEAAARRIGVIAPLIPMRSLSMGLAGTDVAHHRDFVNAAESYRRQIQRVLNRDIEVNSRDGQNYEAGASLWAQVPEFIYSLPTARWVVSRHAADMTLLVGWLLVAVVFAFTGVRSLRVD